MKYEYKVLETPTPTADADQLNREFGADGWMLTSVYEWQGTWYYVFIRSVVQ